MWSEGSEHVHDLDTSSNRASRQIGEKLEPVKRCTNCQQDRPLDQFHPTHKTLDGYRDECKKCVHARWDREKDRAYRERREQKRRHEQKLEHNRARYRANRAAIRERARVYNATYRDAHREEINARERARRAAIRETIRAKNRVYGRAYREANREQLRAYDHAHRAEHGDRINARRRALRAKNREQINERRRARYRAHKLAVAS